MPVDETMGRKGSVDVGSRDLCILGKPYILSFTCSFMVNTRPLVGCLENLDRKVKQFRIIPRIASSRLVYSPSIQCPK